MNIACQKFAYDFAKNRMEIFFSRIPDIQRQIKAILKRKGKGFFSKNKVDPADVLPEIQVLIVSQTISLPEFINRYNKRLIMAMWHTLLLKDVISDEFALKLLGVHYSFFGQLRWGDDAERNYSALTSTTMADNLAKDIQTISDLIQRDMKPNGLFAYEAHLLGSNVDVLNTAIDLVKQDYDTYMFEFPTSFDLRQPEWENCNLSDYLDSN
jgi:hypothetical protein